MLNNIANLMKLYPLPSLFVFAIVISFLISLVQKYLGNPERMKELKKMQKSIQKKMKEHQKNGNQDKVMELQKEMFSHMGETFKHSMKPMLITMVPMLILIYWLKEIYTPLFGGWWIAYYIVFSLIASFAWRKALKLH